MYIKFSKMLLGVACSFIGKITNPQNLSIGRFCVYALFLLLTSDVVLMINFTDKLFIFLKYS